MYIPPPLLLSEEVAKFPTKVQLASVGEEDSLYIPAPATSAPPPEFPLKMQSFTLGAEDSALYIPPPRPQVLVLPARFPTKAQLVSVGEEE